MRVKIEVHLRKGVADPEGANTLKTLHLLGFDSVKEVRSAKLFEMDLGESDLGRARKLAEEMCRTLLANPVIHDYKISVEG